MRRTVTGIALALLTLGLLTPGSPARAATPTPTLTIATPGPLQDLAPVTVTGSGLTPDDTLDFMECQGSLCTYASGVPGTVDASGHLTLTATARRYLRDYMEILPDIDCAYDRCGLALVRRGDYEDGYLVVAEAIGTFARTVPATPTVTVEMPAPLPAVVSTRLIGHGFAPGTSVLASRCRIAVTDEFGRAIESCDHQQSATADADGNVAVPIELRRKYPGTSIDCVDPVWQCSVRLDGPAYGATARAALLFDPTSMPPPPPKITVSPIPVAHVAGVVTVVGHGFRAAHAVDVGGPGGSTTAATDATGSFTATITVQRYTMGAFHGIDIDPVIDCAAPGACSVGASTGPDDASASAPITFAAHSDDPTLVLDGSTVVEGNGETNTAFRVHLDRPAPAPVTFWYLAPSYEGDPDLRYEFGTEEIPAGTTELSVPIVVHGDHLDEPDHHTGLKVVELTGAQLSGPPFIPVTVVDDDPRPAVRVGSITVREGNGPQFAFVPVTLNAPSGRDVTVDYVTHHDTAGAGSDYVRVRGSLVIPAGQTRGSIPVVVLGDRVHETSERFRVTLDDAHNARIADGDANVTVHDDD